MFYSTDERKKLQTQLVYGSPFVPGKKIDEMLGITKIKILMVK